MFIKENNWRDALPLYDVKELTMEEALLVLAADKERVRARDDASPAIPPLYLGVSVRGRPRAVA